MTYVLKRFVVRNYLLHPIRTNELVFEEYTLLFLYIHDCSVWEQHRPWCAISVVSGLQILANGVAKNADSHDQSSDVPSTGSRTVWLIDRNVLERYRTAAAILI